MHNEVDIIKLYSIVIDGIAKNMVAYGTEKEKEAPANDGPHTYKQKDCFYD